MNKKTLALFLTLVLCAVSYQARALVFFAPLYGGAIEAVSAPLNLKIILTGDSTLYGRGGNNVDSDGIEGAHIKSPARILSDYFTASGYQSSSHSIIGTGDNDSIADTIAFYSNTPDMALDVGSWTVLAQGSIGNNLHRGAPSGAAGILTFSFDNVDIISIGFPIRSYGTIEYRIDGGSWVSINENGTNDLQIVEIDTGVIGAHTVEFRNESASNVYLNYVDAWKSTDDIIVSSWGGRSDNSGVLVSTSREWHYKAAVSHVDFDAIVINYGINDVRLDPDTINQATFESNMAGFISEIQSVKPDAIIFLLIPNDISKVGGLSYVPAAMANLASTYGLALLDSRAAPNMADYATADAAGLMYDGLHPNDLGYAAIWTYLEPLILTEMGL